MLSDVEYLLYYFVERSPLHPPTDVHIDSVNIENGSVSVIVQWSPSNYSLNCFFVIYWMSANSNDNGDAKLTVSWVLFVCALIYIHAVIWSARRRPRLGISNPHLERISSISNLYLADRSEVSLSFVAYSVYLLNLFVACCWILLD